MDTDSKTSVKFDMPTLEQKVRQLSKKLAGHCVRGFACLIGAVVSFILIFRPPLITVLERYESWTKYLDTSGNADHALQLYIGAILVISTSVAGLAHAVLAAKTRSELQLARMALVVRKSIEQLLIEKGIIH